MARFDASDAEGPEVGPPPGRTGSPTPSASASALTDKSAELVPPGAPSRADERRQALVAAAFGRIANDGFEGLRTRDVAADVGVNIATLHYYFPTKEALIRGVIGYAMQRFTATMPRDGSPAQQLRAHLRTLGTLLKE